MNILNFIHKHKVVIAIILLPLVLYFLFSAYISFSIYRICDMALKDVPYNENLSNVISKENYEEFIERDKDQEENLNVEREISHTFPLVFPPLTATSYRYTYIVTEKGVSSKDNQNVVYGSSEVDVDLTLDYSVFPFKIVDVYEAP